ncbi:MAG: LLM class F420-dependent oxidoreductase [Gammaproteobacteria bacterium]
MKLGLHIVNFTLPGGPCQLAPMLTDLAVAAEDAGVSHLSVMDHFFQLEFLGGAELDMLEAYTTMGFLAACTRRIELGLLVGGVTYRHPGLLAKTVSTLDVLSRGRAWLGLGAAWYEREHVGLGVPFPPLSERFARLEETLQICLQMWSPNDGAYGGRHYRLAETRNVPQPLRRPPILIGGGGERRTLRLVARYADACNLFSGQGPADVAHKLDVLRAHCEAEGRDFDTIAKTMLYLGPLPTPSAHADFIARMRDYAAVGIERVMVMPGVDQPDRQVRSLAPAIAALAEL